MNELCLFAGGGGGLLATRAHQLAFREITRRRFAALNAKWHSILPHIGAINTMRVCYGADYMGEVYAVAAWSNPVARVLHQHRIIELRRFAICPAAPRYTASRMLGWMARDIWQRYPIVAKLISYQDTEYHTGTIYKAAGWSPVKLPSGGGEWLNRQRWNRTAKRRMKKIRWELGRSNR